MSGRIDGSTSDSRCGQARSDCIYGLYCLISVEWSFISLGI